MDSPRRLKIVPRVTVMTLSVGAGWIAPLHAQQQVGFVLTVYDGSVGARDMLAGRYDAAIAEIRGAHHSAASIGVGADTNACVAYAIRHRLREAQTACDAALAVATREWSHASGVVARSRASEDSAVAIAYANRAVVHALAHQAVSSAEDLAQAHALAPAATFVARNIAAFRATPMTTSPPEVVAQQFED